MRWVLFIALWLFLLIAGKLAYGADLTTLIDNTVHIQMCEPAPAQRCWGGTGSIISYHNKQYLLTNRHICWQTTGIAQVYEHGARSKKQRVLRISKKTDLCLLTAAGLSGGGLKINPSSAELPRRTPIYTVGRPRPGSTFIQTGQILLYETQPVMNGIGLRGLMRDAVSDVMAQPGCSGSPIVIESGELIGVVFAYDRSNFTAILLPVADVQKFLKELP